MKHSPLRWLRRRFLAGLLVLLPLAATIFVIRAAFNFLDGFLAGPFERLVGHKLPGVGLVSLILLVLLVGIVVRSFVGSRVVALYEALLARIPFARSVYSGAKQFTEALTSASTRSFETVVLVEYPRRGLWSVGFVTCVSEGEVQATIREHVTNVFIPTTPNPTSGFLFMVPTRELIPLSMSVEEAIKLIVSGGLVAPAWSGSVNPVAQAPLEPASDKPGLVGSPGG
jgi:uncharacterized membrane protein